MNTTVTYLHGNHPFGKLRAGLGSASLATRRLGEACPELAEGVGELRARNGHTS